MKPAVERLELHVAYDCANRCVFCSEANRLRRFRRQHPSPRALAAALRAKRREGFSYVAFTGGEPTLLPWLPQLLKLARALGYRTSVTTNGRGFADRAFAAALLPLLDEVILSAHGHSGAAHDALTGRPGSFALTLAALANIEALARPGLTLITNTLAVKGNLAALPATLRLLCGCRAVKQCLVSLPAPEGRAAKNYARLAPDLRRLPALAEELARIAARAGKTLRFFGAPACALGRHAGLSNDLHWSPRLTVERGRSGGRAGLREEISWAPVRRRYYSRKCLGCRLLGVCGGFFSASGGGPGRRPAAARRRPSR